MSDFNPSEPAILHDRLADAIETWTAEDEAGYRTNSKTLPDGAVAWRLHIRRMRQRARELITAPSTRQIAPLRSGFSQLSAEV
jgi:hypothetical protein